MQYLVIKSQWIRNSTQSGEWSIAQSTRKREAHGLARHNYKSHLQMVTKHYMYDVEDYELDEENLSVTLADADGLLYHCKFYVEEINEKLDEEIILYRY